MATLTTITADGDGTIGGHTVHDAGTGAPFYTHANDAPDGLSSDWVANDTAETSTTAYFSLTGPDADFGSLLTLNIDVDVQAVAFGNDTCSLTAQVFDAEGGNPLTDAQEIATEADTTRTQRNVAFGSLTGSKAQWTSAVVLFTWTYSKVTSPDNAQLHLFGFDIDGTYNISAGPAIAVLAHLHRKQMFSC